MMVSHVSLKILISHKTNTNQSDWLQIINRKIGIIELVATKILSRARISVAYIINLNSYQHFSYLMIFNFETIIYLDQFIYQKNILKLQIKIINFVISKPIYLYNASLLSSQPQYNIVINFSLQFVRILNYYLFPDLYHNYQLKYTEDVVCKIYKTIYKNLSTIHVNQMNISQDCSKTSLNDSYANSY